MVCVGSGMELQAFPAKDAGAAEWAAWLSGVLQAFGCQTGTLHEAEGSEWLILKAQIGVPEELHDKIARIPVGKGIAGAAAARKEPVELCNLQQDLGDVARPDARKTGVSGSLAVPIQSCPAEAVLGTLGIGKYQPYEFTAEEKERLMRIAALLAESWGS